MDVAAQINHARQLLQMGRMQDAHAVCARAMEADPTNADGAYLLGMMLLQQGQPAPSAEWLMKAAAGKPGNAEVHANAGHALRAAGRFAEAAAMLERAIAIKPDYANAYNNLGMVRRAQGRLADAVAAYRSALSIVPNLVPANFNLGNALRDLGRYIEAVDVYRRVVALIPSNPDAHVALAGALEWTGDMEAAKRSYESALELDSAHVATLVNYGLLLKKMGRVDESLVYLRRAGDAAPQSAEVQEKLGRGLWDAGIYDEGLHHFEEALRIRPTPATRVAAATLVPPVYTSLAQIDEWRERLVREVDLLQREGVTIDVTNQPARSPFYVPYAGLDDREILREIALLHRPPADPPLQTRSGDKIRVGFISSFFRDHTVGLWTQGLIAKLPRDRFHVTAISSGRYDDDVARFIRSHANQFVELPVTLPEAREAIAGLALDVLIYADLGMEGITYTLAMNRLAPVQCAMWGHPSTSGIAAIDSFISSELAEAAGAEANYTEKLVRLKHLPLYYFRPLTAPARSRADFNLPADAHLYGCLQSTFKLHPSFDVALGEILRRDPAGLILIPRTGSTNWDAMVQTRFAASYPDVADRLRLIDRLPRDQFRALNRVCDVTLAPFPFGAGDTSVESFAVGVPVVTMPTPHLRGNFTAALYRAMGVSDCLAQTVDGYIEIAVALGTDPHRRSMVSEKITSQSEKLFEQMSGVDELAEFLESVARISSSLPRDPS
jgi:protein O-GlcNAc transferase